MPSSTGRILVAYKNFCCESNISHIGLGVVAMNTAKVPRREGFAVDILPIVNAAELRTRLNAGVSLVVVSAPWISTPD